MNIGDSNTNSPSFENHAETPASKKLSIVIATYQRLHFLKPMLESLSAAISHAGIESVETLLCINGPDFQSLQACHDFLSDPRLKLSITRLEEKRTPAEARNIVSQRATGSWILFLDDDLLIPIPFLKNFFDLQQESASVNVWAGPNLTPPKSSIEEKIFGWCLENFLIIGPISYRYRLGPNRKRSDFGFHFSLCNLFVRRDLFRQILFKHSLRTAEENELLFQIERKHLATRSDDRLFVWHYRRDSFEKFLLQIRNYGFGRGQMIALRCFTRESVAAVGLFLAALASLLVYFPVSFAAGLLLWLSIISIQQWILFRPRDWRFYFLPIGIWLNYPVGLFSGFCSQIFVHSSKQVSTLPEL